MSKENKQTLQSELPSHTDESITAGAMSASLPCKPVLHSPKALNLAQAATRMNVSTKTVRRWIHRGLIRRCGVTRKILIPTEDVEKFFEKHSQLEWQS